MARNDYIDDVLLVVFVVAPTMRHVVVNVYVLSQLMNMADKIVFMKRSRQEPH